MIIFKNAALLDASAPHRREGSSLVIEGAFIRELSERPVNYAGATIIDLGGRTLMPGLIDCHAHVTAVRADIAANVALPNAIVAFESQKIMRGMLARGFTTIRDAAGADPSFALAVESGLIEGPRLFVSGRALSQTGGHGDMRARFDERTECGCRRTGALSRIADGVDAVRKAAREELRLGAHQVKIMASGGVASPTDRIDNLQYSLDEITAIVGEATAFGTYVLAHAYTSESIARAVTCGVRTIEHGNLIDDATAALMAKHGAYAVPTLVTYDALANEGAELGLAPASVEKIETVRGAGLRSLERFKKHRVKMGFGSDLLGDMHRHQSREFVIRAQVLSAHEIITSATSIGAEIVRMEGKLGTLAPGAFADLLVVDGDPLADISVLDGQGERLTAILKAGQFVKNELR